jgi:hypothetical protein
VNEGIAAVADALAADLTALDLGQPATVSRAFFPYRDREDLGALTVTVMPRGQERTVAARGGLSQVDHLIDVGIQRRIDGTDEASLAATVAAVEQVAHWLAGRRPSATPDWTCVEARADPLVAEDHALNLRIFTGVVQARLRSHA